MVMNPATPIGRQPNSPGPRAPAGVGGLLDPGALMGVMISALRSDCQCRPCQALRQVAATIEQALLPDSPQAAP